MSEKYIRVEDIPKVCDNTKDWGVEQYTIDDLRGHGHWINKGFEPIRCSVCGITVDAINGIPWAIKSFKYCPYCGAKMDEVENGDISSKL